MALKPSISFTKHAVPKKGSVVVFSVEQGELSDVARSADPAGALGRAFPIADFSGKFASSVELIAPDGGLDRLTAIGAGKASSLKEHDWVKLGGAVAAQFRKAADVSVVVDLPGVAAGGPEAAAVAAGILLRAYSFEKYKTRKDDGDGKPADRKPFRFTIHSSDPAAAKKAFTAADAVSDGVWLARDLVNEPANMLGPVEFADRMRELTAAGLEVEVLDEEQLAELKMGALLAVGQGSERPSRVVVLQWNGAKSKR